MAQGSFPKGAGSLTMVPSVHTPPLRLSTVADLLPNRLRLCWRSAWIKLDSTLKNATRAHSSNVNTASSTQTRYVCRHLVSTAESLICRVLANITRPCRLYARRNATHILTCGRLKLLIRRVLTFSVSQRGLKALHRLHLSSTLLHDRLWGGSFTVNAMHSSFFVTFSHESF